MKAILNLGFRSVVLEYTLKKGTELVLDFEDKSWETFQKDSKSSIKCKQTIVFNDSDEWTSVTLLDGTIIDVHFDYENRSEFDDKQSWLSYIIQAYEYTEGKEQMYDNQLITKIKLEF